MRPALKRFDGNTLFLVVLLLQAFERLIRPLLSKLVIQPLRSNHDRDVDDDHGRLYQKRTIVRDRAKSAPSINSPASAMPFKILRI